jgi:hypothetical protein
MAPLSEEELEEVHPSLQHGPEVTAVHEDHDRPDSRVEIDGAALKPVDRQEQAERVVELARDLALEAIQRQRIGRRGLSYRRNLTLV